jgi:PIN domain nuclease of toxin-antitoxin system
MRALLDTHTFLWWVLGRASLSRESTLVIADEANEIFVSAATAYEIALKSSNRRLELPEAAEPFFHSRLARERFSALPIQAVHALRAGTLPQLHRDPFDRLLIAQSQIEEMPIVSADPLISRYDVDVIW